MEPTTLSAAGAEIEAFLWPEQDARLRLKRRRILLAATDLFVRMGYRKTSVDEIAQQAGVAKGTVYLYYRNKAELAYHALALEKRTYLERMTPLTDASQSARQRLTSMLALGVMMSREMPLTTSLLQGNHDIELALRDMDDEVLADVNARQMEWLLQLLDGATDHAMPRDQLETRGQVLMDLLYAVSTSNLVNRQGMPWHAYARTLADIAVQGVLHESTKTRRRRGAQR